MATTLNQSKPVIRTVREVFSEAKPGNLYQVVHRRPVNVPLLSGITILSGTELRVCP